MAEFSYPVEEQPLPADSWPSVTRGIGTGVFDEGVSPYQLINISNAANTVELVAADLGGGVRRSHAMIDGFCHRIDANMVLSVPAVTVNTAYYIALQFDPVRATSGGKPVQVGVFTNLDRSGGKNYLVLHQISRERDQLLTDAAVSSEMRRIAPTMTVTYSSGLPAPSEVLYGTVAVVVNEADIRIARRNDWVSLLAQGWVDLPMLSNRQWPGHGGTPQMLIRGKYREVRGRIAPTSGVFGTVAPGTSAYRLVDIPEGNWPSAPRNGIVPVATSRQPGFAHLEITANNGQITAIPSKEVAWISLDGFGWWVD